MYRNEILTIKYKDNEDCITIVEKHEGYKKVKECFSTLVDDHVLTKHKKINPKYGLVDKNGKEICKIQYDKLDMLSDFDFFRVCKKDKYGFIDKKGNEICELKYDSAWWFKNGFASVGIDNYFGFIDEKGNEICELKYRYVRDFCNGLARVGIKGMHGFINEQGEEGIFEDFIENTWNKNEDIYYTMHNNDIIVSIESYIGTIDQIKKYLMEYIGGGFIAKNNYYYLRAIKEIRSIYER